jgi:hypothetical protein
MKTCPKCGIEKPLDAEHYYRNSSKPSGFNSRCKVCAAEYNAEYHQNNKEAIAKRKAEHRSRPEVKEKRAEYDAERNSHPENKKRKAEYDAEHYKNNKERILKQAAEYDAQRKAKQPACVYQIVNSVNNKIYIGETTRGELRWKQHKKNLRGNYHTNHKLQADFNKFGEDAFKWSIIKEMPKDKFGLLKEEVLTIQQFIREEKDLYNLSLTIDQLKMITEEK